MKKILTCLGMALAMAAFTAPASAALATPQISPETNGNNYNDDAPVYYPGELTQVVVEWPGTDLELVEGHQAVAVEDWISWTSNPLPADQYYVDGDKLIINFDMNQVTSYTIHVQANTVQDKISGEKNKYIENFGYRISPVQITSKDVVSNPMFGKELESLPQTITVEFPGWNVSQGEYWDNRLLRVRFEPGNSAYDVADMATGNVKSVSLADNKLTIELNKAYTEAGWYSLGINYNTLSFSNETFGSGIDIDSNGLILMFNVVGYTASPANMAYIMGEFDSFTIYSNNIQFKGDLTKVKVKIDPLDDTATIDTTPISQESVTDENGTGIKFTLDKGYAYPGGTAKVTIPASTFSFNGANSPAITLDYYLRMEIPQATAVPASGSTVNGLSNVAIIWGNESPLTQNSGKVTLSNGTNSVDVTSYGTIDSVTQPGATDQDDVLSSKLVFDFSQKPVVEPGTYTLSLPAGFVTASVYKDKNKAQEFTYTVNSTKVSEAEFTPAEGTVDEVSQVEIEWTQAEGVDLKLNNLFSTKTISVTVDGAAYEGTFTTAIEGNVLTLNFSEPIQEGELVVTVPEAYLGGITDAGAYYTAQTVVTYTVGEPETEIGVLEAEPTVTPESDSTVESLDSVVITWGLELTKNEECTEAATINDEEITGNNGEIEGKNLTFTFTDLEDGEYTIVVPAEFVIAKDEEGALFYNKELVIVYTVSSDDNSDEPGTDEPGTDNPGGDEPGTDNPGEDEPGTDSVTVIEADANGLFKVYNLQGVEVMTTGEGAQIRNLAKGLYIINGKKVVIR